MINCWCHKWRINLNQKKTNVLYFNGKYEGNQRQYSLINQTAVTQVTKKRVLGVIIDEKLTFMSLINYINFQAKKSFFRLATFPSLIPATLATTYKSFIRSRIKYYCSAWSHRLYSNNNLKNLESIPRETSKLIRSRIKCKTNRHKVTRTNFDWKSENHAEASKPT